MSDPSGSTRKEAEEKGKRDVPGGPAASPRALFGSTSGEAASPSRGRLWLGLLFGGSALLLGIFLYRVYTHVPLPAPPPPPPAIEALPPPAEGPPLPLDAALRIEGGTFKMGSLEHADEQPVLERTVAMFDLDLTEVTVAAYRACVMAGKCTPPGADGTYCTWDKPGMDRHPANCLDWEQASQYCAFWDKRLPTEQEWEYAATGADGRRYPWKDGEPSNQLCWNGEGNDLGKDNRQGTCAVGRYPKGAAPSGALDMAGNVWEWTANSYCPSYEGKDCAEDRKVIRGGAWNNVRAKYVRAQDRSSEPVKARNDNVGFRCAKTPK